MKKSWLAIGVLAAALAAMGPARARAACDAELEAIGAVSASYLYTTYTAIGALADGYVNKAYEDEQINQMMAETVNLLDLFVEQMEKVRKSEISPDDKKSLDQMSAIARLLKKQAEALVVYAKSDEDADAKKFDQARNDAWKKLKVLLDIKE